MFGGLYAAANAMEAATEAHETTARNLAHISVPGFRRSLLPFETLSSGGSDDESADNENVLGAKSRDAVTDFTQGPVHQTGNPLDVALDGEGFFVVTGPEGPLYSRSGTFHLNGDGEIVNTDGLPIEGENGGPLKLPDGATPGSLQIAVDGTITAGKEQIGKFKVVTFTDLQQLQSVGATLFQAPDNLPSQPATARVTQGAREMSNVSAVSELVALIAAQRHYESAQKAITAIDRVMQKRLDSN